MTKQSPVVVERDGTLGRVILNRPELRNPMDREMSEGILAGMQQHLADPEVRSIVISGRGDAFCAGGDLGQMSKLHSMSGPDAFEWAAPIVEAQKLMLTAEKPVIAAVNGPAYAGGMGLAGMCDIILAVQSATFAMPEIKIGLFPMIIVAQLVRSMPRKQLLEMMLTGDPITADEARALGFVNRVAPNINELEACVQTYARKFEKSSPMAVRLGRRAFNLMSDITAEQALEAAQFMNVTLLLGDDFKEGATSFLEKRKPLWSHSKKGEEKS
jgi:enoyl-CoA hydratase/carnithine racemase